MKRRYHQSSLRKGRRSEPGSTYAVTKNQVERHTPLLIPDPYDPLCDSVAAQTIVDALKWLHEQCWYFIHGYVVMTEHIHVVARLGDTHTLSEIWESFSKYTSRRINQHYGRSGKLWQKTFYDHNVRDADDLTNQLNYIRMNPVRKGYVEDPDEWPFGEIHPEW